MRMCKQQGYEHVKILDSVWYTPSVYHYLDKGEVGTIGIVMTEDTITGEKKSYIGLGKGENQILDEDLIISAGAKFYGELR